MPTYNFEKVSMKRTRKDKCPKCSKKTQETKEFFQTINPFNKNKNGDVKTYREIMDNNIERMDKWLKQPFECYKCKI